MTIRHSSLVALVVLLLGAWPAAALPTRAEAERLWRSGEAMGFTIQRDMAANRLEFGVDLDGDGRLGAGELLFAAAYDGAAGGMQLSNAMTALRMVASLHLFGTMNGPGGAAVQASSGDDGIGGAASPPAPAATNPAPVVVGHLGSATQQVGGLEVSSSALVSEFVPFDDLRTYSVVITNSRSRGVELVFLDSPAIPVPAPAGAALLGLGVLGLGLLGAARRRR